MNISTSGLRRGFKGSSRPLHRRLTLLSMLAVAVTLIAVCVTGWVALRVTLFDINERGSLLIAQDLVASARPDITTTGGLSPRVLGPGSTVVEAVGADGTVLLTPGEDTILHLGQPEVTAAQGAARLRAGRAERRRRRNPVGVASVPAASATRTGSRSSMTCSRRPWS